MSDGQVDQLEQQAEDIFADRAVGASSGQPGTPIIRATDLTGVNALKHDAMYLLSDSFGDIAHDNHGHGLYSGDTRFLSRYELRVNGARPVVLRAGDAGGFASTIHLSNPDLWHSVDGMDDEEAQVVLRRHSLGIIRQRLISSSFRERVTITNYTTREQPARLAIALGADFADIFEVRGVVRERRGEHLPVEFDGSRVTFAYRGLDGVERRTWIQLSEPMERRADQGDGRAARDGALFVTTDWQLVPGASRTLEIFAWTEAGAEPATFDERHPAEVRREWRAAMASLETSHPLTRRAIARAVDDLRMLVNPGPAEGEQYVAAGLPWFSTLFGRDALITALQMLPFRPQLARETLGVLARRQARDVDEWRDAEPGKILHELRAGEMARAGEIPHTPYYGTVDATPLWLMLLDEYERWTADLGLVERLWPNALAAMAWIEQYGDADGDGFVEYIRHSRRGLANQGWKDSAEAIRSSDGRIAEGPIALVEVQGYVYAARRGLARLARLLGDDDLAERQERAADELRERFEEAFWMPAAGTYALALDGVKQQVDALASNAGHALWSGICAPERAASVARVLTSPPLWSGWGIRTLSPDVVGYNPIGYHIGAVWPFDNAICAAGFARYGLTDEARLVAAAMIEATEFFRDARLPELFCGFDRATSPSPVPYPVACSPQAWSAGVLFQVTAASLGLRPAAGRGLLELVAPRLPAWLPNLVLRDLRVGDGTVDLRLHDHDGAASVEVMRQSGHVDIVIHA